MEGTTNNGDQAAPHASDEQQHAGQQTVADVQAPAPTTADDAQLKTEGTANGVSEAADTFAAEQLKQQEQQLLLLQQHQAMLQEQQQAMLQEHQQALLQEQHQALLHERQQAILHEHQQQMTALESLGALADAGGAGGLGSDDLGSDDMSDDDDNRKQSGPRRASRMKKPHLQGRFSGRLATKEDERRLASECRLLAPLVGGVGKRGDRSRLTLAKIVRGIATGDVRKHLDMKEQQFKDMAGKLDQLVQGNTTKHVRELQATIDQLRRELDVKTRRILQLEALPAGQQGVAPASQAQANLLVVQAGAGMLGGLGGAGMLAAQGLDDTLLLEQQVQQAQAELQHHQAQAQAAAQTHSVTLAHTQALHAEVRNLAALQKQQGETEENSKRLREMAAAAAESESKVQLAFQTHHHHMQQANQVQVRLQQLQTQIALKRTPGAASNANQLLTNLQQLQQRQAQAQAQAAQQVQQLGQARPDQVVFTLAGQPQSGQASVMLFDPSMLQEPVIQW